MDEIENLKRELRKAQEVLSEAQKHLGAIAEGNAALHCAQEVFYSPLHAKITSVLGGVQMALKGSLPSVDRWQQLIEELSRCEHGRKEGNSCAGCGDVSLGNQILKDQVIGHDRYGGVIIFPPQSRRDNPEHWRAGLQQIPTQPEASERS